MTGFGHLKPVDGSSKPLEAWVVNAFTTEFDGGNPAAVVLLQPKDVAFGASAGKASNLKASNLKASGGYEGVLSSSDMQSVAALLNLSETAFVTPLGAERYQIRWFTPTSEIDLCGHATLASAWALKNVFGLEHERYCFESASGELGVFENQGLLTLDFAAVETSAVEASLNLKALDRSLECVQAYTCAKDDWLLLELTSEAALKNFNPSHAELLKLKHRFVVATAKGTEVDFVSRCFAPKVGIYEDPVTGAAHCALTPFWAKKHVKKKLTAKQVSSRGGVLHLAHQTNRVWIGGDCRLAAKTQIYL